MPNKRKRSSFKTPVKAKRKKVLVARTNSRKKPSSSKTPVRTKKKKVLVVKKNPRKRSSSFKTPVKAKKIRISVARTQNNTIHQPKEVKRFPVQEIHKLMEAKSHNKPVKPEAAIYLTSVLEYLAAEIWELSIAAAIARSNGGTRNLKVTFEDVWNAIANDPEICELMEIVRVGQRLQEEGGQEYKEIAQIVKKAKLARGQTDPTGSQTNKKNEKAEKEAEQSEDQMEEETLEMTAAKALLKSCSCW